jgi:filamentous hemagglutinin family protein
MGIVKLHGFVLWVAATAMAGGGMARGAQLPVPCLGNACSSYNKTTGVSTPVSGFVTQGQAGAVQSGNTLTVTQTSNQAILNWSSFNISADGKVVFQQPGATAVALNKIYQASPSAIFGELTANGQIYLINPNGFVFGSGSTVNVAGLMASSLGLYNGDAEFAAGLLSPIAQSSPAPALASDGRVFVTDESGKLVLDALGNPQTVQVVVQPGAQMTAGTGGRLLLAGQTVVNGGSLSAPEGQIALAAGQSVYLAASGDPSLRGLLVEVTGNTAIPGSTAVMGTTTNQAGASLSAPQGNVSLIGLAVNQQGRISATTAVAANGSVVLQAGTGSAPGTSGQSGCQNGAAVCLTGGGTLTIGSGSDIEVLPDLSDTSTAVVGQQQTQSRITLQGKQVFIDGGQIKAPGGTLNVVAAANPDLGLRNEGNTEAQLRIGSGTNIDLSGSDAQLPMSANLLSVQLRGNELEDDPDQRTGALHGQTVIVDTRLGRPAIISQSSWTSALQGVQESILQRTASGGTASFLSDGDIVVASGATVNVSGGQWSYAPGTTQTSQLLAANGRSYDISTADPSLTYTGVLNPTYTQTYNGFGIQTVQPTPGLGHYESGYVQGFSAGTVTFAAPSMALQGTLLGAAVNGPYQRSAATIPASSLAALVGSVSSGATPSGGDAMAVGATLVIGDSSPPAGSLLPYFFAPGITFTTASSPLAIADGAPYQSQSLQLPVSYLTDGGFSRTQLYSDFGVTLPAGLPLNLGAGGSLSIVAPRIAINSDIQALGGSITLQAAQTADFSTVSRTGISIEDGVTLDVRGQWTNDSPAAPATTLAPTYQDGGSIALSLASSYSPTATGGELILGDDVNLLASGGAWVKANNAIVGGAGGSISLDASPYQSALQLGSHVSMAAFGVKGATGGSFSLAAPRITVAAGTAWAGAQRLDELLDPGQSVLLGAGLFSQDGFSTVNLTATAPVSDAANNDVLTIAAGTAIDARAQSLQLVSGYQTRGTGGTIVDFALPQTLPVVSQTRYVIGLSAAPVGTDPPATTVLGDIDIQSGASLIMSPNSSSSITLTGDGNLLIDGLLRAPGGSITAHIAVPPDANDRGFLPDQRLELGPQGTLDVSGATVLTPNAQGLLLGTVLSGGSVSLQTDRGELIADPGSSIDVAGASAVLDRQVIGGSSGYTRTTIGSVGGGLLVQSRESVSLLDNFSASGGASSGAAMAGGSFELDLSQPGLSSSSATPFPTIPFLIELVSTTAGSSPSPSYANLALLGMAELEESGIDALTLRAASTPTKNAPVGTVLFASATPLSLGREITLDVPNIAVAAGVDAKVNAPYVALTNSAAATGTGLATAGSGALDVSAGQIVLSGFMALQGVGTVTLSSSGDVELEPTSSQLGALSVGGNLSIDAERVYPATGASYTIAAPQGTITILQSGSSPGTPLSAGGSLTLQAVDINSSGTLLAPFGQIALQASHALSLADGSVTSVSADGSVIPFGQTRYDQAEWVYSSGTASTRITTVPTRQVVLTAPQLSMSSGATVDLRGGGDLSAYEWVPGLGGSVDALGVSGTGLYAVLPSTRGQYVAYDPGAFAGSGVTAGASVYLSGVAGLSAGVYPLLPARYALMPGAYLIKAEPGYQGQTAGTLGALPDGTPIVAGYQTFGNGAGGLHTLSAGYSGFAVWPGDYGQSLAKYAISDASTFFAATANAAASASTAASSTPRIVLPADAGTLMIGVSNSLNALGQVLSAAASGGAAATIDIYTTGLDDLTLTANSQATVSSGVALAAPVVQSWAPGDLVLGGQLSADGSSINVTARAVTVGTGAQLTAGEILAVANQRIDIQSGAQLASSSGSSGTGLSELPASQALTLTGTGAPGAALLAVSDARLPLAARSGTATGPLAGITVEDGATLSTRGALALDAPGNVAVAGTVNAPGASWSLASSSIAFVGAGASSTDTLQITPTLLTELQSAGAVRLASAGVIDIATPVSLGVSGSSPSGLGSLTLIASSINNLATGASQLAAQTLTLQGVGASATTPVAGTGALNLTATTLQIGAGTMAISGDAQTTLQASGMLVGQGAGTLLIAGDAQISAAALTATSGSATTISLPTGTLSIAQNGSAPTASTLAASLAGNLTLSAQQIQDGGSIVVPGGQIALQAAQNLTLSPAALVDASGITVSAGNQTLGAAGGIVTLGAGGDLTLASGSTVSVAGAGTAPGGVLSLAGGGAVTVGATLNGKASGAAGGQFAVDAGQLVGGLPALAASLANAGFSDAITVRARTGDLDLPAGTGLVANRLMLTADSGAIDVAGTLSAPSAALRGSIGLFASGNVTLESTAVLQADGGSGRGGDIELSTVGGSINVSSGSVSASGTAQMGTLLLRAPAITSTGDVAISALPSSLSVGQVTIEPVLPTYTSNADFTADFSQIQTDVGNFLSLASSTIPARFSVPQGTSLVLEPGVVVATQGDLSLSQPLDLYALQIGAPIDLTVRASGSIALSGSISDGFDNSALVLSTTPSSALRFVAGADLASANPLATVKGTAADLVLGAGSVVQTGTGDIDLVAANDVKFGVGAAAFTTGIPAAAQVTLNIGNGNTGTIDFPTSGGNLEVDAGRDVVGTPMAESVSYWQLRNVQGGLGQYGVNFTAVTQSPWELATFGGGDVHLTAGRDVLNATVAAADSLAVSGSAQSGWTQTHYTSGGLITEAARDIVSSQFFIANGEATLSAGHAFAANLGQSSTAPAATGSMLYLGDAQLSLWAQDGIAIASFANPTVLAQPLVGNMDSVGFFTYGADAALTVQSTAGNVTMDKNRDLKLLVGQAVTTFSTYALDFGPPTMRFAALSQDLSVGATLDASDTGQLQLFAGRDILNSGFIMSDAPDSAIPTVAAPALGNNGVSALTPASGSTSIYNFYSGRHASDPNPALIAAGRDISVLNLSIPKASQIDAGRDIINLNYRGQNLTSDDVTLIDAGRDFSDVTTFNSGGGVANSVVSVQLGGPGRLDLLAGRNVDLGFSAGIATIGNLGNPNLTTAAGAAIDIVAGLGQSPDYADFYSNIIAPSAIYQQDLIAYMASLGEDGLSLAQAEAAFTQLSTTEQRPLIDQVFFNELNLSGLEANATPALGYTRGYKAVDTLFPGTPIGANATGSNAFDGDLNLTYSRIYTLSGGAISLLVPGGAINVGLANPPAAAAATVKPPSQLGIVAQGAGDVDIYSLSDVNVNASRIFTLGGGNILIWSQQGSIDAGNGAKSSLSLPPPSYTVDKQGNVQLVFNAAVAGSGIRTIQTSAAEPAGNVDLIAPSGSVNAGDAGIGAAGNINIAAVTVTGASNINFGGTATGVPVVVSNLSASLSGASSAASSATTSASASMEGGSAAQKEATPLAQTALSWLEVFVTGLGEEDCKPDDLECLKRQKRP